MCESNIILNNKLIDSYNVDDTPHNLIHYHNGDITILLEKFSIEGTINYSAIHKIENCNGVKKGYMIIIGEQ